MGFVVNSPDVDEQPIANIDFYPEIDPNDCRNVMRVGQQITPERLRHTLIAAIITCNDNLNHWKNEQRAAGYNSLGDVPADQIDDESIQIIRYRRAVYNHTKAELCERYRDYDSTLNASQRADDLEETIDDYRRQHILAMRQIMGIAQTTVELI